MSIYVFHSSKYSYKNLCNFADINVPLIWALVVELLLATYWVSWTFAKTFHFINLTTILIVPVLVINFKAEHVGPGKYLLTKSYVDRRGCESSRQLAFPLPPKNWVKTG